MKLLFSLAILCWAVYVQAQKPIFCGNDLFKEIVKNNYPELDQSFDATFKEAQSTSRFQRTGDLTIQVVVHVVWNDPSENLHDSIVLNQIQILNEDYNRTNADTSNLRSLYGPVGGTGNIHFELAEIVRVHTDELFHIDLLGTNLLAEVKHTGDGGSDAWNTDSYLNIWITKIQPIELLGIPIGQILGFAFPPSGLEHWPDGVSAPTPEEDGVVLDYRVIGRNNPATIEIPDGTGTLLTVEGRSATHEVGHYLGLRHIWGDGGLLGPNDCQQSDGIDDTPYANAQSAFDCDKTKNTCLNHEDYYGDDMPDLIENFMDYASDDCMNMFTKGQVELMRNVLTGPRSGLIENVSAVHAFNINHHFSLSPNPVSERMNVSFSIKDKSQVTFRLSDQNGHLTLATIKDDYLPGEHQLSMNVDGFAPGIYFLQMITSYGAGVQKFIISNRQ